MKAKHIISGVGLVLLLLAINHILSDPGLKTPAGLIDNLCIIVGVPLFLAWLAWLRR